MRRRSDGCLDRLDDSIAAGVSALGNDGRAGGAHARALDTRRRGLPELGCSPPVANGQNRRTYDPDRTHCSTPPCPVNASNPSNGPPLSVGRIVDELNCRPGLVALRMIAPPGEAMVREGSASRRPDTFMVPVSTRSSTRYADDRERSRITPPPKIHNTDPDVSWRIRIVSVSSMTACPGVVKR